MPDNLTRREFMKDLGMFGAAASLAPIAEFGEFDWDKGGGLERPAFIKEVDQPTIEIDWDQVQRYNETNTCRRGFVKYVGQDRLDKLNDLRANNLQMFLENKKPGYTLKDNALNSAVRAGRTSKSFLGPQQAKTPEELGVPKWTGTPEEASQMITVAMRHMGAATVGFVELETNTTENRPKTTNRAPSPRRRDRSLSTPSKCQKRHCLGPRRCWVH
jgi:hypothetical protein